MAYTWVRFRALSLPDDQFYLTGDHSNDAGLSQDEAWGITVFLRGEQVQTCIKFPALGAGSVGLGGTVYQKIRPIWLSRS